MSDSPEKSSPPDPKRMRHALEYYLVRIALFCLSILPMRMAAWCGRRIGDLLRVIDRKHRERAYTQIRDRLGLEGPAADRFVRDNFRHYGMVIAEFAQLSRLNQAQIDAYINYNHADELSKNLLAENKGLILITPHFGNWEWSNSAAHTLGLTGGSVARPLDNPRVNELVRQVRERNGLRILDKKGAIRKALGILRKKGAVGVLIDQDGGRMGIMSPFLGKPASTMAFPVELALRTGSPMLVVGCKRTSGPKRFTFVHRSEPFRVDMQADKGEEVRRLVDALNAEIGRIIMEAPEQWLWVHRRWKSAGERK